MATFWKKFIKRRKEGALERLSKNIRYRELCGQQEKSAAKVGEILLNLTEEDRQTMSSHFETETKKFYMENKEMYKQGAEDCIKILGIFGMFDLDRE